MEKISKKEFLKSLENSYFLSSVSTNDFDIKKIKKELKKYTYRQLKEKAIYKVKKIMLRSNDIIILNEKNEKIYRDFHLTKGYFKQDNALIHLTEHFIIINLI